MIKGVNHRVIEVLESDCEFFERVIFFVKPEFSALSEGTLRDRAQAVASTAGAPPPTRLWRSRALSVATLLCAAALGAGICAVLLLALR
ncbi:MAG: hypothetical protein LBJ11_00905 [Oscillospiraceae bacterium]|jgi:hypothetical protein|nr:hypothetical protein [Oscillospiraceae bacterium]